MQFSFFIFCNKSVRSILSLFHKYIQRWGLNMHKYKIKCTVRHNFLGIWIKYVRNIDALKFWLRSGSSEITELPHVVISHVEEKLIIQQLKSNLTESECTTETVSGCFFLKYDTVIRLWKIFTLYYEFAWQSIRLILSMALHW